MYPVLHETGFASQPRATDRHDGLKLKDLYITAAVRCAPPDNKPLPQELAQCSHFLDLEIAGLANVKWIAGHSLPGPSLPRHGPPLPADASYQTSGINSAPLPD